MLNKIKDIYDKKYKQLLIIPILILLLSLVFLANNYSQKGELIQRGISLKGGTEITIYLENEINTDNLEKELSKELEELEIREITEEGRATNIIITTTETNREKIINTITQQGIKLEEDNYSIEITGPAIGNKFYKQTLIAVLFAFTAMGIVVLITFKSFIPSLIVVFTAFADITSTLAATSLLDVKLSLGGVAAFLMIIGYSVDTDILLTSRVLTRKEGTIFERTLGSLKTGLTMSLTSLFAVLIAYFFTSSELIQQIMLILSLGFLFDIIYTWLQNTAILRWYLEYKNK